jgi:predicted deacylase
VSEIIIGKSTFQQGESGKAKVNVAKLPSGTIIHINVHVFRGKAPGPVILLLGGLHGDEINGVEIIRKSIAQGLYSNLSKGTIIAIPIFNVYGFINFSRDVPDGKDVNRSFPGSLKGSLASRVAHVMTKKI